jgi:predicted nucleic acid-binding protein
MNEYVVDTVALVLRLESRQMGGQARQRFVDMEQGNARLHVPTIVFAEILYLAERKRITTTLAAARAYLSRFPNCLEAPLTLAVTITAQRITDIPELHDRLIAATALHLQLPLLTNDIKISASNHVQTLW